MDTYQEQIELEIETAERRPNRSAANSLLTVLIALLLACALNEVGVFEVERGLLLGCLFLSVLSYGVAQYLAHAKTWKSDYHTKYVIITICIVLTFVVSVLLNNNATLLLLFPMLMATRYRSLKVSWIAVAGSGICAVLSPVMSWRLGTWSLNYMTGFIETVCHVSVAGIGEAKLSPRAELVNILMYISLPQLLVVMVFGSIILSITHTGIRSMEHQLQNMKLSEDLKQELKHVVDMQDQILYALADIVENRDVTTGNHVKRTSAIVRILVENMKRDRQLSEEFCHAVIKAAPLHDIGKVAVDDAILRKPGKLTPQERQVIQKHSEKSAEMIHQMLSGVEDENFLIVAENLSRHHHEWYDGSGYPDHLKGEQIPLEARIMAIADVYDALVSKRSYKEPVSHPEARDVIRHAMGTQFDPGLSRYFEETYPRIKAYYEEENLTSVDQE